MSFKENLKKKIAENTIESELAWKDKDGIEHKETVFLKRSRMPILGDWGRIYPPIDKDDKINYMNLIFGGYRNLIKMLIMLALVIFFFLAYKEVAIPYATVLNNPCVQGCLTGYNPLG